MTSSPVAPYASLQGVQQARVFSFPPYATTAGDDAISLGRMAGIELDPWQQAELRHEMAESSDWKCPRCTHRAADPLPCPTHPQSGLIHPWAAFECCDIDPRQNGKSEKLIVRMLAGLYVLEEPLQIYSAHLFDTATEILRRLAFVIENCDELRSEVKHRGRKMVGIKWSHGDEGVELRSGVRIRFKARTGGGGRGFSCDTLYLDEAMILPEAFLGATVPTLSARANPQIWLAGSAPDEMDPSHDGVVLTKRRVRAQAGGDPSLAYFEHSADFDGDPDDVPDAILDDPQQWALANPGMGRRITGEYIANERRAMGRRQFAIERLGIGAWANLDEDALRIFSSEVWDLLGSGPDSEIVGNRAFAIDVDPGQAWATIAEAGEREDGLWHVGIVEHKRGVSWVVAECLDRLGEYPDAELVVDPRADLADLLKELAAEGVAPLTTTAAEYKDACGAFFRAVIEGRIRYQSPEIELDTAAAGAQTKRLLDAWKWDRASPVVITPLIASTLALWGARTRATPEVWNLSEIAAQLRAQQQGEEQPSEPVVPPAPEAGQNFIPLDQMPARRGLFG